MPNTPLAGNPSPAPVLVSSTAIGSLDLSPLAAWAALAPEQLLTFTGTLEISLDWPRADDDPRELSEIPEVRLWCLRADAVLPWLPLLIERSTGQLTRHVAMLLPHGFSRGEGIRFAPEALELWITHRLFLLDDWASSRQLNCRQGLVQMAAVLGLEVDAAFWDSLGPGVSLPR
ncbi:MULTISPECIES: CRR6 family NdhI maturation factor [Aphanothece]|uniref:CRR6 family NdhI maturation factor n=1 Tax=Aphanothece TaxID=1121 RepID=UPI003984E49E